MSTFKHAPIQIWENLESWGPKLEQFDTEWPCMIYSTTRRKMSRRDGCNSQ